MLAWIRRDALKVLILNKHVLIKDMREAPEDSSLALKPKLVGNIPARSG
jgi:hypothetical protein